MSDQEVASKTISKLPENASTEEIAEELQIMAAIREGKAAVNAGRMKTHVQVGKLFET